MFRVESLTSVSSTCVTLTPPPARTIPSDSARKTLNAGPLEQGRGEMEVTGSVSSIMTEDGVSRASAFPPGKPSWPSFVLFAQRTLDVFSIRSRGLNLINFRYSFPERASWGKFPPFWKHLTSSKHLPPPSTHQLIRRENCFLFYLFGVRTEDF